jgi:hypothetical protein
MAGAISWAKCEIKMAAGVVGETNERSRNQYNFEK